MEFETGARPLRNIGYDESRKIMDNFFRALETDNHFPVICRMPLRLFPILMLTFLFSALLGVHRHLTITPYRKLFQLLEGESFDSPYLRALQKTLLKDGTASVALKELESI